MRARDRARKRDVILVIDHYVPEPDRDAGSCTVLCYHPRPAADRHGGQVLAAEPALQLLATRMRLQDMGVEVAYGGDADTFRQWLSDNGDDLDLRIAVPSASGRCGPS